MNKYSARVPMEHWESDLVADHGEPVIVQDSTPVVARIFDVLWRRKWIVVGCVVGAFLMGLVISLLMTPQYTAVSLIEIQRENQNLVDVDDASSRGSVIDQEFYETEYGLLQSQTLAQRVANRLNLVDSSEFFELMGADVPSSWFPNGRPSTNADVRADRERIAGELLLGSLNVDPDRLSRLVRLHFTSPDAPFSKAVANAWPLEFTEMTLERRFEATSYARNFLEDRLNQLRVRINESERQLVDYASRENIVNLPGVAQDGGGVSDERSLLVDNLATLNAELSRARADRIRAESRLGSASAESAEAIENSALAGLRQRRAEVAADYSKMMVQFEADYPPARALKAQLDELDDAINMEVERVAGSLRSAYQDAARRERRLESRVEDLTEGVLNLRRRSIQYNILQREADTNRQLYDALLQRYKEIGVAGNVGANNILIVDNAELPQKLSSPRLMINLLLSLLAGTGLGVAAAFIREQFDQSISDPGMIERRLGASLLGTIPREEGDIGEILKDQRSTLSEAYLSLRTKLSFTTDHGVPRSITVSSSQPFEGKSTTSLALAQTIARGGKTVLLIDGDMRSPSQHEIFHISNKAGFSSVLSGNGTLEELAQPTHVKNLSILPSGPTPPNVPDLIVGSNFDAILDNALKQYDHVIIDSPPVMGLADAPLFGSKVEATVFVVEFSRTRRGMVQVAIERLRSSRANLVGIVLTKFDPKHSVSSYGYDYGYGYGYGESVRESR